MTDHNRSEETVEIGIQRHDGFVTWELRVCGVSHGEGNAESAAHAMIDAGFLLRNLANSAAQSDTA